MTTTWSIDAPLAQRDERLDDRRRSSRRILARRQADRDRLLALRRRLVEREVRTVDRAAGMDRAGGNVARTMASVPVPSTRRDRALERRCSTPAARTSGSSARRSRAPRGAPGAAARRAAPGAARRRSRRRRDRRALRHQARGARGGLGGPDDRHDRHRVGQVAVLQPADARRPLRDAKARALYLYPTKALAQDQARAINALGLTQAGAPRDLRRRHAARGSARRSAAREPRAHEPRHAAPGDPAPPPAGPTSSRTSRSSSSTRRTSTAACSARTSPTCCAACGGSPTAYGTEPRFLLAARRSPTRSSSPSA